MNDNNINPAATTDRRHHTEIIKEILKDGMALNNDQLLAATSTDLLLKLLLLRLLDERVGGRAALLSSDGAASDQQLTAAKKEKKRAAAAAKKKRNKRNKAAAKHRKIKLGSWLGGAIISLIMMVALSSIISPFSLIHQSDGSGDGEAPPALPPSASRFLRQKDHRSNSDIEASTPPDIISPLPAAVPPIFSPAASNRRLKYNELRTSSCLDTRNWKDINDNGCD